MDFKRFFDTAFLWSLGLIIFARYVVVERLFFPEFMQFLFEEMMVFGYSAPGIFWISAFLASGSVLTRLWSKVRPRLPKSVDIRRWFMSEGEKYLRDNNINREE